MKVKDFLKAYILSSVKILSFFIASLIISLINIYAYSDVFGGFPYPILKFSVYCLLFWITLILIISCLFHDQLIKIKKIYIDSSLILCSAFGILGFATIQLEQKNNVHNYATIRYESSVATIDRETNSLAYRIEYWNDEIDTELYNISKLELENTHRRVEELLVEQDSVSIRKYLDTLITLERSTKYNFVKLIYELDNLITLKKELDLAEEQLKNEKERDFDVIYLLIILNAIVLGFLKISIVIIDKIKTAANNG